MHRYVKASNKYVEGLHSPMKESSFLLQLDANNLHGWAIRQTLPTHNFGWISNAEQSTSKNIAKLFQKEQRSLHASSARRLLAGAA